MAVINVNFFPNFLTVKVVSLLSGEVLAKGEYSFLRALFFLASISSHRGCAL